MAFSCCFRFFLIHQYSLLWCNLKLIFWIHQHFAAEFLDVATGCIDISTLSYCVKLEVEFVDTSTFPTEFLDVASGFC